MTVRFVGNMGDRYAGFSTDTKLVVNVRNGSMFEELDTGASYVFYGGVWYSRSTDVNLQDQHTRPFDFRLHTSNNPDISLAVSPTVNTRTVTLAPGHGVVPGLTLAIIEEVAGIKEPEIFTGKVLTVVGDVLGLDMPISYPFSVVGSKMFTADRNMNVDGSITPVVFALTNILSIPIDVVRFIFHITSATSMDDGKFGGRAALPNGILLRKKRADGYYTNYWNIKTNGQFGEIAFDKYYDDKAPAGVYGMTCRITYGGQSKHGVTIRLNPGESIELVVQDDLSTQVEFGTTTEGHLVE